MLILFLALISVFTCGESRRSSETLALAVTNPFDGTWQLDRSRDLGSLEELLALAGVNFFTRKVIISLEITEQYTLTSETFRVARRTSHDPDAETVQVYRLGALETVQDAILGGVQSLVRVSEGQTRIQSSLTRPSDHAVFIGTRHVTRENPRLMIYSLNITLTNKQKAGCVRHYVKQ